MVPMDSRTLADPYGVGEYTFYRTAGVSWTIPCLAGLYALGVQVDPNLTPTRFLERALASRRTAEIEHDGQPYSFPLLDPVLLLDNLRP